MNQRTRIPPVDSPEFAAWMNEPVVDPWDTITALLDEDPDYFGKGTREYVFSPYTGTPARPFVHLQPEEEGNEPVKGPGAEQGDQGGAGVPAQGRDDVPVPAGHHRIEFDQEHVLVPRVVHKVFFELPLPPSEVWTDREWTFWPQRSVPHYNLKGWEQIARSVVESTLMTVGLRFLNVLEGQGRNEFSEEDLPMLETYLVSWMTTGRPNHPNFWWDEAVVVGQPGTASRGEARQHYAGRRLSVAVLRASAARCARALVVGSARWHRVQTAEESQAWRAWLKKPYGAPPIQVATSPTKQEQAYFSIHGHYPPIWRPRAVALAQRQAMLGRKSGEARQPDRAVLLSLPVGLTVPGTVAALAERGIYITTKTVQNWRGALIKSGAVQVGHEPWRTTKGRVPRGHP